MSGLGEHNFLLKADTVLCGTRSMAPHTKVHHWAGKTLVLSEPGHTYTGLSSGSYRPAQFSVWKILQTLDNGELHVDHIVSFPKR